MSASTRAHIVLAHRSPRQVLRLIDRLAGERSWVFVHIDARAPEAVYGEIAESLSGHERATLIQRNPVSWSGWGTVEAMHTGFRAAMAARPRFDHVIVMSGQDYPIRPREEVDDFMNDHLGCSFITHVDLPSPYFGQRGGLDRVTRWHRPIRGRRVFVPGVSRRFPAQLRPLVGSSWFCLSREAVQYALAFRERHPATVRYFRHVWAPDEHYMQSVVASGGVHGPVFNENLWHIEWSPPGPRHPDLLTLDSFERLQSAARSSSNAGGPGRAKLWARKFDQQQDGAVLDRIDRELLAAVA